jgi:hypothetical protein
MTGPEAMVADYLERLERAAVGLPPDRRSELLEGIAEHISSADAADEAEVRTLLDRLGEPEEIVAAAREDLPAGGWPPGPGWGPAGLAPAPRGTGLELAAVLMLTLGSFLPVAGWLVGVVLLWTSSLWRVREKLLGTLVVPLGPGGIFLFGALLPLTSGSTVCTGSASTQGGFGGTEAPGLPDETFTEVCTSTGTTLPGWAGAALLVLVLLAPVVVAVVLMRTARRRAAAHPVLVPQGGSPYGPSAYGPPPASPWGALEITGVLVLGLGGLLIPVVGPLIGLALVLASPRWTRTHKLVAACLCVLPVLVAIAAIALRALEGRVLL